MRHTRHSNDPRASCVGKQRYDTRREALGILERWRTKGDRIDNEGGYMQVYPCRYCRGWHIGSTARYAVVTRPPARRKRFTYETDEEPVDFGRVSTEHRYASTPTRRNVMTQVSTPSAVPTPPTSEEVAHYTLFEMCVTKHYGNLTQPLFTTDVDPAALWQAYLDGLPEGRRQYYNCRACQNFIERYAGLVTITDGLTDAVFDFTTATPPFFRTSVENMRHLVLRAKVTGVFYSDEAVCWGTPTNVSKKTGQTWTHLFSPRPKSAAYRNGLLSDNQAMAEKREEFKMLKHGLAEYGPAVVAEARRVLASGALYRSEKASGMADWLHALHEQLAGVPGRCRDNVVWSAVATAPVGFCHVRSNVVHTLMDDIVAGLDFQAVSKRWAEKLHPLQYQRPTAAPKDGAIDQAEKLFDQLGLAPALVRRFAKLEDVLLTLWTPPPARPVPPPMGGIFDHLRQDKTQVTPMTLPPTVMTWEKFRTTVLPTAQRLEALAPYSGSYYGLVTAVDPTAPPLLQWDGVPGRPRNPVSWYFYNPSSTATRWGLPSNTYVPVTAVFPAPPVWQESEKHQHQGEKVFFSLAGCRDQQTAGTGLALFPECLRSELHGVRAVVEAFSRRGTIEGAAEGTANGLAFQKSKSSPVTLRVTDAGGNQTVYTVDRWD